MTRPATGEMSMFVAVQHRRDLAQHIHRNSRECAKKIRPDVAWVNNERSYNVLIHRLG